MADETDVLDDYREQLAEYKQFGTPFSAWNLAFRLASEVERLRLTNAVYLAEIDDRIGEINDLCEREAAALNEATRLRSRIDGGMHGWVYAYGRSSNLVEFFHGPAPTHNGEVRPAALIFPDSEVMP